MKNINKLLALSFLATTLVPTSYGQDFSGEEFSSDVPIDIEGSFERKTEADRVEKLRQKLEQQNEDFVQKKIEDLRYESEQKMADTLSDAFSGGIKSDAVPAKSTEELKASPKTSKKFGGEEFLVTPSYVLSNYTGDGYNIESDLGFEVNIEGKVYRNLTIGVAIGYDSVSAMDLGSSNNYGNGYGNFGGLFRTLDITMLKAGLNTKAYFGHGRFQPYIGAGISMTRANLSFDRQNFYDTMYFGMLEGASEVDSTFFSGSLIAGAMVNFTDLVGLSLQGGFSKGFSSNNNQVISLTNDQYNLRNFAGILGEGSAIDFKAGLVIKF
jgi:hypothetical protein